MNAREFAAALLEVIAKAVPPDTTISKAASAEVDALLNQFLTPATPVLKVDEDRRMVYGWASVISKSGAPIIDRQDDVLSSDDLREAVHDFMKHRTAGDMHRTLGIGEVVESFVFDAAVQKSLGIDLGMEGWYVGVHVPNDEVWEKVKKGEYKAFSIGGTATRVAIPEDESKHYVVAKDMAVLGKGYGKAIGDGTPSGDKKCPKCGKMHKNGKCGCGVSKAIRRHPKGSPQGGEFAPSGGALRGRAKAKEDLKPGIARAEREGNKAEAKRIRGLVGQRAKEPDQIATRRVAWMKEARTMSVTAGGKKAQQAAAKMTEAELSAKMKEHLARGGKADQQAYSGYAAARGAGKYKKETAGGGEKRSYPKHVKTPGARKLFDSLLDNPKAYILNETKMTYVNEGGRKVGKEKMTWTLVDGAKKTKVTPAPALGTSSAREHLVLERGPTKGSTIIRAKSKRK